MSIHGIPDRRQRREDFPVDSFRYLEAKLQEFRTIVMRRAAEMAESTDSHPRVYRVAKRHVDRALCELLSDPAVVMKRLGIDVSDD